MSALEALAEHGQSIWLDYIRRDMTRSGELARLVADGLRGMTSNPAIFQKSIGSGKEYAEVLGAWASDPSLDAKALYERIAIEDIREAADALRPVYDASGRRDGFVSLEVAPGLARETEGTVLEARRLWARVDRPNLMIKVPGTPEGIVAIAQLIAEGINVNVTLIFAQSAYEQIANAYLNGLERRVAAGLPIHHIASVASFFVSRIDTEVDARLEAIAAASTDPDVQAKAHGLLGKIAVANAKLAYRVFEALSETPRWQALAAEGAQPQRLLWASTGTKNKAYRDVLYVEELIGRETVNTVPPATLDAFRDHGVVAETLTTRVDEAEQQLHTLDELGIAIDEVTDLLLEQGLVLFVDAMDSLLATVAAQQRKAQGPKLDGASHTLPPALAEAVAVARARWDAGDTTTRLWARDASVWTGGPEAAWLGWLDIVAAQQQDLQRFRAFADDVKGFEQVLLLGMGGSSLFPEVLAKTYGPALTGPKLSILDSTVPAQVLRVHAAVDPKHTLFIVASKSGSTLEPEVFLQSFLARARTELGDAAARHFVAITDPGSKLEAFAREAGFRAIFHGVPEIGGRFSALSDFGLVPAAAIGLDVEAFLAEAALAVEASKPGERAEGNPGVELGLVLGTAARLGKDKLTIIASPAIASFGAWLEQLVAESTGKHGKAIIPIDGESLEPPERYGDDRLFVYLRLRSTPSAAQDAAVAALERAGHAVVRIETGDVFSLPQEVFRFELATAVAGAVLGIDPFDQPDVEASKIETRKVTAIYSETGSLPPESPFFAAEGIAFYSDSDNARAIEDAAAGTRRGDLEGLAARLRAHLDRVRPGDYLALLAYLDMTDAHVAALQSLRHELLLAKRVATALGFGPRFLHSTGQAYKGGPNTGVFLQITSDDAETLAIPGRHAGPDGPWRGLDFGVIKAAQARGDFEVLAARKRRALRVHLGKDVALGLRTLERAVLVALGKLVTLGKGNA